MDNLSRRILDKEELDSIYLATTNQLEVMNKIILDELEPKEIDKYLKEIKTDLKNDKNITEEDVIDIFGGLEEDTRKIKKLANKTHREQPKNKYSILKISKTTKAVDYKLALNQAISKIEEALNKSILGQDISAYMWAEEGKTIDAQKINIFNLNSEDEVMKAIEQTDSSKVNLYKINLLKGTNVIAFSNCVYYDNQNKTLPIGMDKDTRIIAKLANTDITLDSKKTIRIGKLEEEEELSSKLIVKTINILEYTVKQIERNENGRI